MQLFTVHIHVTVHTSSLSSLPFSSFPLSTLPLSSLLSLLPSSLLPSSLSPPSYLPSLTFTKFPGTSPLSPRAFSASNQPSPTETLIILKCSPSLKDRSLLSSPEKLVSACASQSTCVCVCVCVRNEYLLDLLHLFLTANSIGRRTLETDLPSDTLSPPPLPPPLPPSLLDQTHWPFW